MTSTTDSPPRVRAHGPMVLCLHSSASSPRQWHSLAQTLGTGYRVAAPALIGYGDSPDWDYDRRLSLDDEAQRLEQFVATEQGGVHLVGHSYGGAVALKLALRRPKCVRSLSLYEPVLFHLLGGESADRVESTRGMAEISAIRTAVHLAERSGRATIAARLFVEYWAGVGAWDVLNAHRQATIAARMCKVDAEFDALHRETTSLVGFGMVNVPVLLLVGEQTRYPARRVADILEVVLPNVSRVEIRNAGHMGPISHAAAVDAQVGAFLDTQVGYAHLASAA